jgi:hypothetical protein
VAASKQIINAAEVRNRYSLQDISDVNSALESGISGAHLFFQGILGTAFNEATLTDIFYLDTAVIAAYNKQFRLRLTQAFVKPGTLVVSFGDKRGAADSPCPAGDFYFDLDRGLVFLDAEGESGSYANKFVVVSYTAGFGTAAGAVVPPDWLKEALLSWMSAVLVFSAYKEEPGKAVPIAEAIKREATQMVERYKRETALQFLPIGY